MRHILCIVCLALLTRALTGAEVDVQPPPSAGNGLLTIDDLLSQETLHQRSPIAATSCGRYLAVTVWGAHEEPGVLGQGWTHQGVSPENVGSEVVLIDLELDQSLRPFAGETRKVNTSFTPVFSPDGRYLAAYVRTGDRHLRPAFYDLENGEMKLFDGTPANAITAWTIPAWLPDSSGLVFQMRANDPETSSDRLAVRVQRHGLPGAPSDRDDPEPGDTRLALLTVATGELRILYSGFSTQWRVSPDGKRVAVNTMRPPGTAEIDSTSTLVIIDIESGESWAFDEIRQARWGPQLSFSDASDWLGWTAGSSAGMICLERRKAFSVPGRWQSDPPGWTPDGAMVLLANDGLVRVLPETGAGGGTVRTETIIDERQTPGWASATWNGPPPEITDDTLWLVHRAGVDRIDPATGTVTAHFPARLGRKRAAASTAIFSQRGDNIYRFDLQTGEGTRVFSPRGLPPHKTGKRLTLKWSLPGDQNASGHLFLPPGHAGEPIPVVVDVYAGRGLRTSSLNIDHRILTAAGYGVFMPEIPIAVRTDLMREIQIGADAAMTALLESGVADPTRLAIQGQSFGTFTVFSILTAKDGARFQAAMASNGTMDLLNTHQLGGVWHWWVESGQGGMAATPWENRERYLVNAPYWYLERVNCPVLLLQGEADTPRMQMVYESLKRLDKQVELRIYEGGGHGPMAWPASQQRDYVNRLLEWYAEHL